MRIVVFCVTAGLACLSARPERPPLRPEAALDNLEQRARAALDGIAHAVTRAEVEGRRADLRKRLSDSLGRRLLPWPPDLRTVAAGSLQRDGYRVEKILFQGLPGMAVPAHVYVPDGLGTRAPAVLIANGHAGKALPETQVFGIRMAKLGFVALSADSIGQGERPRTRGHRHPEAVLVGLPEPGMAHYEIQCALEYLRSRQDVDAARIGMTGANGGGFATWIAAALDDRIRAAIPVDDTFDFYDRIRRMRVLDWNAADDHCQLIPGVLRYANMQEFIAMTAPRHLMMMAAPEPREIWEYAQRVYANLGAADRLRRLASDAGGYDKPRREAAYGFFLQALMNRGDGSPVEEPRTETMAADSPELACAPPGAPDIAADRIAEIARGLAPGSPVERVAVDPPGRIPFRIGINARPLQRVNVATEARLEIPLTILRPGPNHAGGRAGTLVAIDDEEKEALASDAVVQEALRRDWLVVAIDPRGFGELKTDKPGWVFAVSLLLGENFVWRQAWDLRFLIDNMGGSSVAVYARGRNASLVASYAIGMDKTAERPHWAVLRGGITNLGQLLDDPKVSYPFAGFGALRMEDIPQLLSAARTTTFLIDPVDPERARAVLSERVRLTSLEQFLGSGW